MNDTALAMGQSFDQAKNDDLFYLPPEAFDNPDFKRGLAMFLSPDGKSARMFITHETDPATTAGIGRVDSERKAAQDALKMSSLSDAKIFLGGVAATYKDMSDGAKYDLMIAVVSALTLIFMIMLILTRSAVAALVIVATAASSIAASFGISVLIWQDLFGIQVHWLVMLMSVIILLAVGSDYNLLLVSRFRDEIHAGLKTGIIRSMAGTGGVVTSAGLVFAATMAAMLGSKLIVLAQMGSTIAIGLLVDTLIVRSLLMPSIATLLGRWFWWPQVVYPRGDNHFLKPQPPRPPSDPVPAGAATDTGGPRQSPSGWVQRVLKDNNEIGQATGLVSITAAVVALAAPAHADLDTDFANQLHGYGIYGPRDYNAWLGKITCKRLGNGTDADAYKSAAFLSKNLPRGTTTRRHGSSSAPRSTPTALTSCRS